jgi:Leucine-rich repeat (LRR) protein
MQSRDEGCSGLVLEFITSFIAHRKQSRDFFPSNFFLFSAPSNHAPNASAPASFDPQSTKATEGKSDPKPNPYLTRQRPPQSPTMANLSISSFPSDLPCTSEEHIYFSGHVSRSYRDKTGKWAVPAPDGSSIARAEQFSAIAYEYAAPSDASVLPSAHAENQTIDSVDSAEQSSVLESDSSSLFRVPPENDGTVIIHKDLQFDPLSSFATHQVDHKAQSYVDTNAYPTTVRQVYGSLSLHNEKLIKAITDATGGDLDWETLKVLDISGKGLTSLHGLDKYCPALWSLNIDDNFIENLDGCPAELRVLHAKNNRISDLTYWAHLPHLCRLNAADNKLENVDGLAELLNLIELDVSGNRLKNLNGLAGLAELRKLDASNNFLERVEWETWHLQSLIDLDLNNNMIYTVDPLDALPHLEKFNLERNEINSFNHGTKRKHMRLREINLKTNSIMSFEFYDFPVLQVLDLDDNLIMSAACLRELSRARSLIKLSLRNQQESRQGHKNVLLDTMMNMRGHFQELYLSENSTSENKGIIAMPSKLKHRNIRVLEMATCAITRLPLHFGQYFPACHTMNLNHNHIDDIAELRGLEAVEKLLLANNKLDKPKTVAHLKLPELRILDLRDNTFNQGWYNKMYGGRAAPVKEIPPGTEAPGDYELPGRIDDMKTRWFKRLPDIVQLKRLFIGLLLARSFPTLAEVDGAYWDGQHYITHKNSIMASLGEHGMLGPKRRY